MVLIFNPAIIDVKNISIIGKILIVNKNKNFLSLRFILGFKLEIKTRNMIIKPHNIPNCFPKKING